MILYIYALYNDMYDYMMTIPSHHQHHFSFTLFISFFFFPPLIISHRHPALYSYFSLLLTFHWPQFSFYLSHLAIQMEAQNFFVFSTEKHFYFIFMRLQLPFWPHYDTNSPWSTIHGSKRLRATFSPFETLHNTDHIDQIFSFFLRFL